MGRDTSKEYRLSASTNFSNARANPVDIPDIEQSTNTF